MIDIDCSRTANNRYLKDYLIQEAMSELVELGDSLADNEFEKAQEEAENWREYQEELELDTQYGPEDPFDDWHDWPEEDSWFPRDIWF